VRFFTKIAHFSPAKSAKTSPRTPFSLSNQSPPEVQKSIERWALYWLMCGCGKPKVAPPAENNE
jgi:hypothetical protein